jgi:hypothetical protein
MTYVKFFIFFDDYLITSIVTLLFISSDSLSIFEVSVTISFPVLKASTLRVATHEESDSRSATIFYIIHKFYLGSIVNGKTYFCCRIWKILCS